MIKEFREFILRGNVLELAVAVVIGAAFNAIVNSLVEDIITPLIGILMGGIDFSALNVEIGDAVVAYGRFLQSIFDFLVVGFVLFLIVRTANRVQRRLLGEKQAQPAPIPRDIVLLTEIRDLLKAQQRQ